jgi:hypothetical protein
MSPSIEIKFFDTDCFSQVSDETITSAFVILAHILILSLFYQGVGRDLHGIYLPRVWSHITRDQQ